MLITIDTEKPISQTDILLLAHLVAAHQPAKATADQAGVRFTETERHIVATEESTEAPIAPAEQEDAGEPAAEPVAEEKPKRKRRTKAEMEAARAAEAAEQADDEPEAAPADAETADAPSPTVIEKYRAEAVEKATAMVADGERAKVVEALESVGAKKVSQIADDKLAAFLGALAA